MRGAWLNAHLGVQESDLAQAIEYLDELRTAIDLRSRPRYSIQAVLLTFLTKVGLREDAIPEERRADVMLNLGKFSKLISDYEAIHFRSSPHELFEGFIKFLYYQAEEVYQAGLDESVHTETDAVQVMTVHQAKGMQWPVVFLPALLRNRFPSAAAGGASVWHLIPPEAVANAERYRTSNEDEARLFYVAMTRSQKFLHLTWAPIGDKGLYYRPSEFWSRIQASKWVQLTRPSYADRPSAPASSALSIEALDLSFSNLRHFLRCPYEFKLRVLYGFSGPNDIATGYGAALHNALAEIHTRAGVGQIITSADIYDLVELHMRLPFAGDSMQENLKAAARRTIANYVQDRSSQFQHIEFVEKDVEVNVDENFVIRGRIDLVERRDLGETTIIDLKSSRRSQSEEISEQQLHTYTLGYQQLTGWQPEFVEIYDLDARSAETRAVDSDFVEQLTANVKRAANAIRRGSLVADPTAEKCSACGVGGLCSAGERAFEAKAPRVQSERDPLYAPDPQIHRPETPIERNVSTKPAASESRAVAYVHPSDMQTQNAPDQQTHRPEPSIEHSVPAKPAASEPQAATSGNPNDVRVEDAPDWQIYRLGMPIERNVPTKPAVSRSRAARSAHLSDARTQDVPEVLEQPSDTSDVGTDAGTETRSTVTDRTPDEEPVVIAQPEPPVPAEIMPTEQPEDPPVATPSPPSVFRRLRRRLSRWSRR